MLSLLLLFPILLPIVGGFFVFRQNIEKTRNRMVLATLSLTAALVIVLCLLPTQSLMLMHIQGSLELSLENDGLSRFFMLLMTCIWVPVSVFSLPYLKHVEEPQQFLGFYTITLGVLLGLAMAKNFVTLYMFFEFMSLITVPLVLHNGTPEARRAGFQYLGYSVFGAGVALAGYMILNSYLLSPDFAAGGVLNLAVAENHRTLLLVVYFLMIAGFGAKAGMMPMQAWLPYAHPVAPAPASAVLSGVITKGGVLAIIRVTYYLFGTEFLFGSWAVTALLIMALITIFVGSMLALREKQLKKRLAYSTISQVSYVLFGLLLLTPGGVRGALLQIVFHALAKDTLFLAAGAIIMTTEYTQVDQLPGIGRRMPVTMWCFALASLSLIGIPPMSGVISKWSLSTAALGGGAGLLGYLGVAVLIVSALLTAGYLLPIVTKGFFPGKDVVVARAEADRRMTVPMVIFSAFALLFGLLPGGLIGYLDHLIARFF